MEYLEPLRRQFIIHANPGRAAGAKAYMRNISDFYGLDSPLRRQLLKEFLKENGYPGRSKLDELVHYAWDQPQREWQYVAMEITKRIAWKGDPALLELSAFMITHKSWWDTVDYISPNIVGSILKQHPGIIPSLVEDWMNTGNLWLQRACLLFQLKYRNDTDSALLFRLCEELSGHKDFFIRKAIGWSLREYSKRYPKDVFDFVKTHVLSPLSQREAIRRIKPD
jgi:3-methyladenine DNA glycosylase AlkD